MKLLFLTVMPSPYQQQLFAAMAATPDISIAVRYFAAGAHDREWAHPDLYSHETVMAGRTLGFLGKSAHWNPGVLAELNDDFDLVVVSDYSALTAQVAMRALALKRRPFVFWGELPGFSRRGTVRAFVRRRLQGPLGAARAIAGIGSGAVEAYTALFPAKPVYNIPYFCDLAPYRTARTATLPREGTTVNVLFSGQLIERKGVDVLIAAFVAIAHDVPRLHLLLLGGGPKQGNFEAMIPVDLAKRVAFLGHRAPAELPATFADVDAFCLPSRHDGWGVVVNEALGAGLPILVSDAVGAGHDLVEDGVNGFVTEAGDAVALADRLKRLATDDALRARMGTAARQTAARWELAEGVERWRRAATEILAA